MSYHVHVFSSPSSLPLSRPSLAHLYFLLFPGETDYNKTVFQPYEHKPGHAIYSISREELNTVLLDELDKMGNVKISFGSKFDGINKETGNPKVADAHLDVSFHCSF